MSFLLDCVGELVAAVITIVVAVDFVDVGSGEEDHHSQRAIDALRHESPDAAMHAIRVEPAGHAPSLEVAAEQPHPLVGVSALAVADPGVHQKHVVLACCQRSKCKCWG